MALKHLYFRHLIAVTGIIIGTFLNTAISYGASIRISWNANEESDLSGYRVYCGTSSGNYGAPIDVGNITSYEVTGLNTNTRYYISLTAYDTSHNESAKSTEVSSLAHEGPTTTSITGTTSTAPVTTTSAATTSISGTSTIATTTTPLPTTIPPNTTSSTVPGLITTTTSSIQDDTSSCNDPQKLMPLSVAASSELPPFFAKDNLIDGDPQTAWSTILSLFRKDASITLDLGGIKSISWLSMYASQLFGIDFLPANIQLQVSNDNSTWETINTGAGYTSLQPPYADSWQINGHECRYIKVCITGRKSFFLFQLAQIAELEIYGCDPAGSILHAQENSPSNNTSLDGSNFLEKSFYKKTESIPPGIPGKPMVSFK